MTDTLRRGSTSLDTTPLPVVSADSHVGPPPEVLRPYCPKEYLDEFDDQVSAHAKLMEAMGGGPFKNQDQSIEQGRIMGEMIDRNAGPGHYDMEVRLAQMDEDGTVSEAMYHGSQNNNPIPLVGPVGFTFDHTVSKEVLKTTLVGLHTYNEWLADACSIAPQRLLGALHLPQWDPELCVEELNWGGERGLRVVNFSAPRAGVLPYDNPAWDPFWSACEEYQCVLTTHSGAIDFTELITAGVHARNLVELEAGGWPARKHLARLIFGGVFARHPGLTLVLAEQNGDWWVNTCKEYDSSYKNHYPFIKDQVPQKPSEYLREHVFIGASFMAPFEAEAAVEFGYADNVLWGRDYPHIEGTWVGPREDDPGNWTRLSMRNAFSGLLPDHQDAVRKMVADNGIRAYHLDGAALSKVAEQIGAPSLRELSEPIGFTPSYGEGGALAFRTVGPWG